MDQPPLVLVLPLLLIPSKHIRAQALPLRLVAADHLDVRAHPRKMDPTHLQS